MAVPESGTLQSTFSKSGNSMLDQGRSLDLINAKISALVSENGKENPVEFTQRYKQGLGRLLGDEYMLAIQNQKPFDLKGVLNGLSNKETPGSLNERAATIENRVITKGEQPDPSRRLRNGTMDQEGFLESAANAIKKEYATTGDIPANGASSISAKESYARSLNPADVANFTMLTEGIKIPEATLKEMAATPKPTAATLTPTPSSEPVAGAPKAP